jgi:tRNA (guanine-N7-)-methyltransferase
LPVPTERETYVLAQDLPVYRVLYRRNSHSLPPLQQLLQDLPESLEDPDEGVDNPA